MKICPNCQTRYTDDTLQFCLQDGTPLIVADENQSSAPTVVFDGETETVVKNRPPADNIQFDLQTPRDTKTWEKPSETAKYEAAPRKSNTALIVTTTILATILLLGVGGIGAWLYFSKNRTEVAQNANIKSSFPDNSAANKTNSSSAFPPPNSSEKPTGEKTATPTPAPVFDPKEVKKEVSDTVYSWKDQAESRDLSAYMSNYGSSIDYYNKKGVSIATVRADKQKAFSTYDTIEFDISNFDLRSTNGVDATAVFDKEWYFENNEKSSEGKVQTQLQLKKIGKAWKIVGEKDLKVYYVK